MKTYNKREPQTQKNNWLHYLKHSAFASAIHNLITFAGLTFVSSITWADVLINPNEIWLDIWQVEQRDLHGFCAKDIDKDGDIDLFKILPYRVSMIENTGTPESPEFASSVVFSNDTGSLNLNRLGISDCRYYEVPASVDIDADGDLDLFTRPYSSYRHDNDKLGYARNDGTTEHPYYVNENPQDLFGLPDEGFGFLFKDIDKDGDMDLFLNTSSTTFDVYIVGPTVYYENIGNPEQASFVQRHELQSSLDYCFPIDLNNDGQWDLLCEFADEYTQYIESSPTGYLAKRPLFFDDRFTGKKIQKAQAVDVDNDGDMDIVGFSGSNIKLYTNVGTRLFAEFDKGSIYATASDDFSTGQPYLSDFDGDGDLDAIGIGYQPPTDPGFFPSPLFSYYINTGTNINPVYKKSITSTELQLCNDSLDKITESRKADPKSAGWLDIHDVTFTDLDGDNDLDLFSHLSFHRYNDIFLNVTFNVYCENQGNSKKPLFASGVVNPFGLTARGAISFGDIDSDGDQDAQIGNNSYDNVGNAKQALFQQTGNFPFNSGDSFLMDIDNDGRVDSTVHISVTNGIRLSYKSFEPATHIAATSINGQLILATTRPSQLQLQHCSFGVYGGCHRTTVLAMASPRELSLSKGDFNADGTDDIVLAMIDAEGKLKIQIYKITGGLQLIGSGAAGFADSISVSAGQLDDDPADEYVVSFVQPDGHVVATAYNLDGSQVGSVVVEQGTKPSVAVGKFDEKGNTYVLAYLNPNQRLETATYRGNGTLIARGNGDKAQNVSISAVDLLSNIDGDEYVTALIKADGTAALIGFAADGTRLGKVVGGVSQQAKVTTGAFPTPNAIGIAVTLIQSDQKPAVIFLDNLGHYLAAGIGEKAASASSIVLTDIDYDGIEDGILIYIDKAGTPRWEIFSADGKKISEYSVMP